MFGLFKKKQKPVIEGGVEATSTPDNTHTPPGTMPLMSAADMPVVSARPNVETLLRDYKAGAASIEGELQALLNEASLASEGLIETTEAGDRRLSNAWNGVATRVRELSDNLEAIWKRVAYPLEQSASAQEWASEDLQHTLAVAELDIMFTSARCQVMARAGELSRQSAEISNPAVRACQFCGGQLDAVRPVSMAVNLACKFCNAVNTIDPGTAWRMFAAEGALALAALEALPSWIQMTRTTDELDWYRREPEAPMQLLERFHATSLQYWTVYESSLARHVPEKQANVQRHIDSKMTHVDKKLRQYPQWKARVV